MAKPGPSAHLAGTARSEATERSEDEGPEGRVTAACSRARRRRAVPAKMITMGTTPTAVDSPRWRLHELMADGLSELMADS